ncbi:hypothetical protein DSO57_1004502 [Entomophthora muscae]|uniref:Uncharacterized protein n=2 Tax=Entomophthora muscae TaxID=34485 RepID=A0ACC2UU58_9FUNG|nr:hypothetical protein DSO57_1004502 [Entomophthora muscae]
MRVSAAILSRFSFKASISPYNASKFLSKTNLTKSYSTSNATSNNDSFDFRVNEPDSATVEPERSDSVLEEIDVFTNTKDFADSSSDWSRSFYGVGSKPFDKEISDILLAPLDSSDIEIKPDGLLYLPEIKYRRILNRAFGPGAWGLVPRGPTSVTTKNLSREYALICHGRFVSQARGEQDYFDRADISVAAEGAKSNALTRCCKDLGIASELWDPSFIRKFKAEKAEQVWAEHQGTKKRRLLWRLKGNSLEYPYRA